MASPWAVLLALMSGCAQPPHRDRAHGAALDAQVQQLLATSPVQGLALAVVDEGRVVHARSFGRRNAAGAPLEIDTVMYGASLTKAVFAYTVLQLVDEGLLDLDTRIEQLLPQPLPSYGRVPGFTDWSALQGDERWRQLTPRLLLSHRSGFANFAFLEPDGKLRFHFEPGARYAYSGEGLLLLQFVLERGLGLDVGAEMDRRVFQRFGMARSGMRWNDGWAANLADGWDAKGATEPHARRSRVRAAGSMDTTLQDFARFAAAFARGEGLSARMWQEMTRAQAPITTAQQFPTLQAELPPAQRRADLGAGLGVVVFDGPQGAAFFKGGHDDSTANTWVCVKAGRRCVVILSNDVRAEPLFPQIVALVLGETGVPWNWEYGF